jgi:biopolymer transport protein ExbD
MPRHQKSAEATQPELPITPMLDMSFQLMFYFVITFNPMPTEAQLALTLPKVEGGGAAAPPPGISVEDEELIIQVYGTDAGQVAGITAALKTGNVDLGKDTSELLNYLKERAAAANGATPKLKFEFAERLNYQYVIKMIDEAKRAGYDRVSPTLLTPAGAK